MSRIEEAEGLRALRAWCADGAEATRGDRLTAVRYTLGELERLLPGRSVEVRVPPAGAVQILGGTNHRRGTPPAVIEVDMNTWLRLAVGRLSWAEAEDAGLVDASGQRTDLSSHLPLFDDPFPQRG